ncbi:hypothetical protein P4S91_26740 [Aneurinibacillus aneurinilyticus]|uniref:hypothetical protein n=1 Tax=Aneurinibacillus aneurinilyticus TaxID=1391 RepID=UPI002E1BF1C2|nr:hypothetical protein [Aneurinibacillus aneurinilyticus]MED0726438.1 hypothetical protein [Aneurinibacillus aneurinilyticus]
MWDDEKRLYEIEREREKEREENEWGYMILGFFVIVAIASAINSDAFSWLHGIKESVMKLGNWIGSWFKKG